MDQDTTESSEEESAQEPAPEAQMDHSTNGASDEEESEDDSPTIHNEGSLYAETESVNDEQRIQSQEEDTVYPTDDLGQGRFIFSDAKDELDQEELEPDDADDNQSEDIQPNLVAQPGIEDNTNVHVASQRMRVSTWEHVLTNEIGGVHSGSIVLHAFEDDTGRICLHDKYTHKELRGMQIYTPWLKRYTKTPMVNSWTDLGHYPDLVQKLLMRSEFRYGESPRSLKDRVRSITFDLVELFEHAQFELGLQNGGNSIRMEGFYVSQLLPEECDAILPSIDFLKVVHISRDESFFDQYATRIQYVSNVLKKTFLDQAIDADYDILAPATKRMLTAFSEIAAKITHFFPCFGRCINTITREMYKVNPTCAHWCIPESRLESIPAADVFATGLEVGLDNAVLSFPNLDLDSPPVSRWSNDDTNTRKLPEWVQVFQQSTTGEPHTNMISFAKLMGLIVRCFWRTIDKAELEKDQNYVRPVRTFFDELDYHRLAECTAEELTEFMENCSDIISKLYDLDWYHAMKSITYVHIRKENQRHNLGRTRWQNIQFCPLADFPTTMRAVTEYYQQAQFAQQHMVLGEALLQNHATRVIDSLGKIYAMFP